MLRQYIEPLETAVLFFPFVAFLFALPFMLYQYHKYGSILVLRIVMTYSFILYLMCAYFLTILPLPSVERVAGLTSPYCQPVPFRELVELFLNPKVQWSEASTWKYFFLSRGFFVLVMNIVMTIPFGIYLRYYFRLNLRRTFFLTLGLSLVFELTQLSGLFFIYPRPYRLADVDDLITNTLGGCIGYWIAPLLMKALPTHERMDSVAYQRSKHVSILRRLCAAFVDCSVLLVVISVAFFVAPPPISLGQTPMAKLLILFGYYTFFVLMYFGVGEWLIGGRSPGKMLLHIRLVDSRSLGRPKLWQCVVRYGIFYLVVLPAPVMALAMAVVNQADDEALPMVVVILCVLFMLIFVGFCGGAVIVSFRHGKRLPHGWLSRTHDISTLRKRRVYRPRREKPVSAQHKA